jgi:hypothetical protein
VAFWKLWKSLIREGNEGNEGSEWGRRKQRVWRVWRKGNEGEMRERGLRVLHQQRPSAVLSGSPRGDPIARPCRIECGSLLHRSGVDGKCVAWEGATTGDRRLGERLAVTLLCVPSRGKVTAPSG